MNAGRTSKGSARKRRPRKSPRGGRPSPTVFVSHASADGYVARKLADDIRGTGATCFLDAVDVEAGDEIAGRIQDGLANCSELVVLLTPASKDRRWVWIEIGGAWVQGKRVVGVVEGTSVEALLAEPDLPIVIRQTSLVHINDVETYLRQLRARVERARG
jgi:hypothetical protein